MSALMDLAINSLFNDLNARYRSFIVNQIMDVISWLEQKGGSVFVKRKCEQKGPKKVSTFSTRFHVVSNVFPKYQMLTF